MEWHRDRMKSSAPTENNIRPESPTEPLGRGCAFRCKAGRLGGYYHLQEGRSLLATRLIVSENPSFVNRSPDAAGQTHLMHETRKRITGSSATLPMGNRDGVGTGL